MQRSAPYSAGGPVLQQHDHRDACEKRSLPHRVLLYTGSYNHIVDGVTLTLNRLVDYLEREGIEVLVVSPTSKEPKIDHAGRHIAIPSIPLPGREEYRIATFIPPGVRREITRFRPGLVHVATPDLPGRWAMSYARRHAIPLVTTYHTDFSAYLDYYRLGRLEGVLAGYLRYFYRRPELVCVPSRSMIEELNRRGVEGRMRVWGRGVDDTRFTPERSSGEWRSGIGADSGTVIINYTGRLVSEKNVMIMPEISRHLQKQGIRHRMIVVGDGPAREELQQRMPHGIFAGHLDGEDLAVAYASSDIFLFPSATETFGNVVLEAMASGLPVVAADATGSRDLVTHQRTGLLAPVDRESHLLEHVETLARDAETRRAMGRAGYEASTSYRWEAILGKMLDYYAEATVLAPRRTDLRRILGVAG